MDRDRAAPVDRRRLQIPYRLVLDRYGALDEAEDDLMDLLHGVLGTAVGVRWESDLTHANPWFHTLILDVSDSQGVLSCAQYRALQEGLQALDLA
ncbi:hypothetical protein ACLB90_18075 [Stenotrophomonas sp. LGBM10]|uniref:hypothetical protein n=1 Tax=Stenotrophomonas sp. LGBM10 TaxID=3390038 RepID=UPI00398B6949